jgi:phenylalanine-4-hydroxylase
VPLTPPAPDIIHEGAGHFIANLNMQNTYAVWRDRLQSNFFTQDYEMYEAIRLLSVKKTEDTPQATIDAAEKTVEDLQTTWANYLRWLKYATFTGGRWNTD